MSRRVRILVGIGLAAVAFATTASSAYAAGTETVLSCGSNAVGIFQSYGYGGPNAPYACPLPAEQEYGLGLTTPTGTVSNGAQSYWYATAPAGMEVTEANAYGINAPYINEGNPYGGGFFWGPNNGDGALVDVFSSNADYGVAEGTAGFPTQTYGFQVICAHTTCTEQNAYIYVDSVTLTAQELTGPTITAGGLWNATGWIRGGRSPRTATRRPGCATCSRR